MLQLLRFICLRLSMRLISLFARSASLTKIISSIVLICIGMLISTYYTKYSKAQNTIQAEVHSYPNTALPIQVYFTPWDQAEDAIIQNIQQAKRSIYIQAYVWTSKPLHQAILDAKNRGVNVFVLADKNQMTASKYSLVPNLVNEGIEVKLEVKYQNAHNKIMIIDYDDATQAKVITGSYNFSYSAQYKNAENVLIIQDSKIAQAYYTNWQKHAEDSLSY
jgi:phosphatidylserine/phosphatidylglycerophosphate/cardiolipin synthase-like enzyme